MSESRFVDISNMSAREKLKHAVRARSYKRNIDNEARVKDEFREKREEEQRLDRERRKALVRDKENEGTRFVMGGGKKKKSSKWITHVKAYAKTHKCTYGEALKKAKSTYNK